ncbi:MAG: ferritin-like domain-containing protein [Actinomycetota bacterium]|nr:ferritin-like domain-containing protein [Actinomycetota bacterium]
MSRHDISHDHLRRELRSLGATADHDAQSVQRVYSRLFDSPASVSDRRRALFGRRDVLRIGGVTVATAAVISACGEHVRGEVGRVGAVPTTVKLPDAIVTNIALLRTASSLEHSVISVYDQVIGNSDLLDPKLDDVAKRFMEDHVGHAALFETLTTEAGGTPWTCGNPKFDDVIIKPILTRIVTGVEATTTATAVAPSDDPHRDVLNFAHGLESLAGATYQALVALFSEPSLRADAMSIGAREARHAALLALTINPDRPGGLVNFTDAVNAEPAAPPTTVVPSTTIQNIANPIGGAAPAPEVPQTEIPTVTAIPSQFGSLGAVQLVVGRGDENGTRLKLNLETPSLNSFVFEYMTPTC